MYHNYDTNSYSKGTKILDIVRHTVRKSITHTPFTPKSKVGDVKREAARCADLGHWTSMCRIAHTREDYHV